MVLLLAFRTFSMLCYDSLGFAVDRLIDVVKQILLQSENLRFGATVTQGLGGLEPRALIELV